MGEGFRTAESAIRLSFVSSEPGHCIAEMYVVKRPTLNLINPKTQNAKTLNPKP